MKQRHQEAVIAQRGTRAEIDLSELEKLCMLHCTDQELADWFGVTPRTIERRRTEPEFAAVMERGRSKGKISLRRAQMRLVESGNAAMAIFMGKNWLNQSDQIANVEVQVAVLIPSALQNHKEVDIKTLEGW